MNILKDGQKTTKVDSTRAAKGTQLYAVVSQEGVLVRGSGVVSVSSCGNGYYEVIFNCNVRQGAYVGTIGYTTYCGVCPAGIMTVVGRCTTEAGVWVSTYDMNGNLTDQPFHLIVDL
jgi:hypothetical protein